MIKEEKVSLVYCDKCEQEIQNTEGDFINGYAVVGNIHATNNKEKDGVGGGLVGDNLIPSNISFVWGISGIQEIAPGPTVKHTTHYCRDCLIDVLNLE